MKLSGLLHTDGRSSCSLLALKWFCVVKPRGPLFSVLPSSKDLPSLRCVWEINQYMKGRNIISVFQNIGVRGIKVTISYSGVQEAPEHLEPCIDLAEHDKENRFLK